MESPYLIIPLILAILVGYTISKMMVYLHVFTVRVHRKIWNTLLLIAFITTAILGLILALQVNYKFKLRFLEEFLIYHVNFGITMSIIAIFHFWWHIRYYLHLFRKKESEKKAQQEPALSLSMYQHISFWKHLLPSLVLGFTTAITQIILVREFLSVFQGNELVVSIILGLWLLLTGWGAYAGRYINHIPDWPKKIPGMFVLLTILPVILTFLISVIKNLVFKPGIEAGLFQVLLFAGMVLLPFCFLSGYLFTTLSCYLSLIRKENYTGKAYALESLGSVIGGGVFSFILVFLFSSIQTLLLIAVINATILVLFMPVKRGIFYITGFLSIVIFVLSFILPIESFSRQFQFKNQPILKMHDSPYGILVKTEMDGQHTYYENGYPLFLPENIMANEETVHFPMVQSENTDRILVFSSGNRSLLSEIQKYHPSHIDWLTLNPALPKILDEDSLSDKVSYSTLSARRFLKQNQGKYDVIISDLPAPQSARINSYFTLEFFQQVKEHMNKKAVFSLKLPAYGHYIDKEQAELTSIIYNTLARVFKEILIIPGTQNYLLAADYSLNLDIPSLIEGKNLDNTYVNSWYLQYDLLKFESDKITHTLIPVAPINKDYHPQAYFVALSKWVITTGKGHADLIGLLCICLGIIIVAIWKSNPDSRIMFGLGFSMTSLEIIVLFAIQCLFGYVYYALSVILTLFMGGLVLGSYFYKRFIQFWLLINIQRVTLTLGISIVVFWLMFYFGNQQSWFLYAGIYLIALFTFWFAALLGLSYAILAQRTSDASEKITSRLYSKDLTGAFTGSVLTGIFIIPLLGILNSILLLLIIITISLVYSIFVFKKG